MGKTSQKPTTSQRVFGAVNRETDTETTTLPDLHTPHFLRPANPTSVQAHEGGARTGMVQGGGAGTGMVRAGQDSRITISFQFLTRASNQPRPEIHCTASLPGGFRCTRYREVTAEPFSPDDMTAFLARLEGETRNGLEAAVRSAYINLKEALGAGQ